MVHADLVHLVAAILQGIELEIWSNQSLMTFNRGFLHIRESASTPIYF